MPDGSSPERDLAVAARSEGARELRAQVRDLVAILGLPLLWRGRPAADVARSLCQVMANLLDLDFLHVRIDDATSADESRVLHETVHGADAGVAERLLAALGDDEVATVAVPGNGETHLHLARVRCGIQSDHWSVVAGSSRDDFPTRTEEFVLRATVEQAALTIENARLYEEARQASHAKSEFMATMSHELRTPLNAILGYIELLQLGVPVDLPDEASDQVGRVEANARHLLEIIDEILTFSRLEAGREEVHLERVDLGELVQEATDLVRPLIRQKGLAFDRALPDRPVVVTTDPGKVRQVLLNLLSNAIKFTDRGSVAVILEAGEGDPWIHVKDTGPGIENAHKQRIFEPFRQVEESLTRRAGGTGLGLSVANGLASLLGGSLELDSEPGRGSTFSLRIPRRPENI